MLPSCMYSDRLAFRSQACDSRLHGPSRLVHRRELRCRATCQQEQASRTSESSSRRRTLQQLAAGFGVSVGSHALLQWPALAEEAVSEAAAAPVSTTSGGKQVYMDVRIEGRPVGRLVVELFDDVPVGAQRFIDLAVGKEGVAYRLSKFDGVYDTYIKNEGVKSLSYTADGYSAIAGGDSTQQLEQEMASASARSHSTGGLVSLIVKEAQERPVKERLVAMRGKLVTLKEQAGEAPNGTAFTITTGPTPELDRTNLVIGKLVGGQEVLAAIRTLPISKPRDEFYNKPFFEAGKAMGDKRATVAEKGFNRPLKRVLIANAGVSQ